MLGSLATSHKIGIAVMAAVFIAFALTASFLAPRIWPNFPGKHLKLFLGVSILVTAAMLASIFVLAKEPPEPGEKVANVNPRPEAPPPPAPAPAAGDAAAGKAVFMSAGCVSCHTLKAANATGTVGPNLDDAKPPASLVVDRVTNGKGVMPSFKGQLTPKQIQDVAAFVSTNAGKG
jgi:mono/diheme cytochrome c family protein